MASRYVEGGHAASQRFAGGHSLSLAARHGDLDFQRFFIDSTPDLADANTVEGANDILADAPPGSR